MELDVLGPLRIRAGDQVVVPGRRMACLVLGVLALRPNVALPVQWLTDCLWHGRPPASASSNLRTHVAEIRRLLRSDDRHAPRVESRQGRYALRVDQDRLDALRFDALLQEGRRDLADGRAGRAVERLGLAVGLWRGPVLESLSVPESLHDEIRRLESRRIEAVEEWLEARLAVGDHAAVAVELGGLVEQYPLRERLWGQLMSGLYAAGRQAEALSTYQRLHVLLDTELGVQPGPAVRELHQRMLRGDPLGPVGSVSVRPRPRQLPRDPSVFVGRNAELTELEALSADPGPVIVSAISGTAGVGKTALALRWAHRSAHGFPDGCLYVDLRGFGPRPPLAPAEVLDGFLRSLGVDAEQLPREQDGLAARYRTELADRRVLVVLDNAESAEQVRPLLPGDSTSRVVVTSRDSLAGLVARDGARRLDLDLLPPSEALDLVRRLVGSRIDAEPAAAGELVEQCARLPLALRVAAELLVSRRGGTVAQLVAELRTETRKLDLLAAGGDSATAVRAVFSWSYQQLPAAAAEAFRLLGLHPGRDVDGYAAAALLGLAPPHCGRLLATLVDGHLLDEQDGRYRMHDLLRAYARELAVGPDTEPALGRLLDHYVHTASAAMDVAVEYEKDRRPRIPRPATATPDFPDAVSATGWLDAERDNLIAVAGSASPRQVGHLSAILHRYLDNGGHYRDARLLHTRAANVADPAAAAVILCNLGVIHWRVGQPKEALDSYQRALDVAREQGDRTIEIRALNNIGLVDEHLGRYDEALDRFQRAARVADEIGDRPGQARALDNLGNVSEYLGQYPQALEHKRKALAIAREIGDRGGEASTLNNIGNVHERMEQHHIALQHYQQALDIAEEIGHREIEGHALDNVGAAYRHIGDCEKALDHHRRAIALALETDNGYLRVQALTNVGDALRELGDPAAAIDTYEQALTLATALDEPQVRARAHDGIGHALSASGDDRAAHAHWREALRLYTRLGAPESASIAARLPEGDEGVGGIR
jgi:DNA-binding SARP family transcriptional activator/tetratricopeptide (TPR) repeat protein